MPKNSRRKGKVGELEGAKFLTDNGFPAKRGQQHEGSEGRDIICDSLESLGFQVECKRTERLNLYDALKQAERDAEPIAGVVLHRRNREKWVFIVDGEEFLRLVEWKKLAWKLCGRKEEDERPTESAE